MAIPEEPADTSSPRPQLAPAYEWLNTGRFALLLGVLIFAGYPEVFLGSHTFFDRDFGLFTYPVAHFTRESIWRGEIPLWNPYSNCGLPFLAQWNTTVCYPPSWIYVLLPLPWSLNFFCLAHLLLAGLGMYWLAVRWTHNRFAASVAGLAYALNGLVANCLMWTSNLAALAWLPIVVLCVERGWREGGRRLVIAAACGTLQMLSGSPEITMLTWVLLGTLWAGQVWGRRIPLKLAVLRVCAIAVLTFLLSAPQLLPFFKLLRTVVRSTAQIGGYWSMPSWGWANLAAPLFRCSPTILGSYVQADQQWTSSYYLGIGVLALAVIAAIRCRNPRVWWLAGVALGGMVLALGDKAILYAVIHRVFPALTLARYPIKFIVLTVFALPLLAAFALQSAENSEGATRSLSQRSLIASGLFCLAALIAIAAVSRLFPGRDESWQVTAINALERAAFLAVFVAALILQRRAATRSRRIWLGLLILVTLGLDLLTHIPRQNPTVSIQAFGPMPAAMSPVPRLGESRAMIDPRMNEWLEHASTPKPLEFVAGIRRMLFCNFNLLDDIPKVNGFFSLNLREEVEVRQLCQATNPPAGLMDFLGVSQISSPNVLFEWRPRTTFLPWATAGQQPVFANVPETLRALAAPDFDARQYLYLPVEARNAALATNAAKAEIASAKFSPRAVDLTVRADQPAWVVVAQSYYPSWRAYVDDKPTHLWRGDHAFQALQVPAGEHRVQLRYEDREFHIGLCLCGAGLVVCILCLCFPRR